MLYTPERDAGGIWCAHAWLGLSRGANGVGALEDAAVGQPHRLPAARVSLARDHTERPEPIAATR
jgi:hypothetical protein